MKNPDFVMLIGVPGSGKSTFINRLFLVYPSAEIISSDNYIENAAKAEGKTYSEVFQNHIKAAEADMYLSVRQAVSKNRDIVWDQTNLTVKSRAKKLAVIPNNYRKMAIWFETPSKEELKKRLDSRPGKFIPEKVMENMINSIEQPTLSEGFDKVEFLSVERNKLFE